MEPMSPIEIRDADRQNDYEFGRLVHHSVYRDVVTRQFGSWDEGVQNGFFKEGWNRAPHKIIIVDGVPAGVFSVAVNSEHVFLSELQILPEYQGRGLGSQIIKQQMQDAKSLKLPLRLQVLRENKAQQLYRRLGFDVTETTDIHVKMEWRG